MPSLSNSAPRANAAPLCSVYAASCTQEGGLYRYQLYSDGTLCARDRIPLDRPMYFIKRGEAFPTLMRAPASLAGESGCVTCRFGGPVPAPIGTGGKVACHLSEANGRLYAANYSSASVSEIGGKVAVHARDLLGPEPRPDTVDFPPSWQAKRLAFQAGRQDAPHPHQILPSPNGRFLLAADLGLDAVFVYDPDLRLVSALKMPQRAGVRHMVFGQKRADGSYPLYAVCELDSTVCALSFSEGRLAFLGAASSHVKSPENAAAAIRLSPDGKILYASQRGDDCISVFRTENGGAPTWLFNAPCGGRSPRDFCLSPGGEFLICANEQSGSLSVLARGENALPLLSTAPLPAALCVLAE